MILNEIKKLLDRKNYLKEWLERFKQAQEAVPHVKKILELTDWEIEALSDSPSDVTIKTKPDFATIFDLENRHIKKNMSLGPLYKDSTAVSTLSFAASGVSETYRYVSGFSEIGTPAAFEYAKKYADKYRALQETQDRINDVRCLIMKLQNQQTSERFSRALKSYNAAETEVGERVAAANDIRNLLYGIKGDLFKKANINTSNKKSWQLMAERLAINGRNSLNQQALIKEEDKYKLLIGWLSDISKERGGKSVNNLTDIWTQVLDHIFIILNLTVK